MYLGRIVAVGINNLNKMFGIYRVSSRSFPHRHTSLNNISITVKPNKGYQDDLNTNPYIAYNCIKIVGHNAIISNGFHTEPIAEKLSINYPARDAMVLSLLALDYEKDRYNTPRIAGIIDIEKRKALLGIVRSDAISVKEMRLTKNMLFYVGTYERNTPSIHHYDTGFNIKSASDAREYILNDGVFESFEHGVTSASIMEKENNVFEMSAETNGNYEYPGN